MKSLHMFVIKVRKEKLSSKLKISRCFHTLMAFLNNQIPNNIKVRVELTKGEVFFLKDLFLFNSIFLIRIFLIALNCV